MMISSLQTSSSKSRIGWSVFLLLLSSVANKVDASCSDGGFTGQLPSDPNYVLVWSDEFDSNELCDDNWFFQTQVPTSDGWYNQEEQLYTDQNNALVENGVLKIVAKREEYSMANPYNTGQDTITKQFTSARLNAKFAFIYGKVEVRAKIPTDGGISPAIWFLGQSILEPGGYFYNTASEPHGHVPWPYCGQINLMESLGYDGGENITASVHTPSQYGDSVPRASIDIATASTEFHVYTLLWEETQLYFFVDGALFYTYQPEELTADTWPFDQPQYMLLSLAVGGSLGGPVPEEFMQATMEIDYIRLYQRENVPTTGAVVTPKLSESLVASVFSEAYSNNAAVESWNATGSSTAWKAVQTRNNVRFQLYTDMTMAVIDLESALDITIMTHLHVSLWTPNEVTDLEIGFVLEDGTDIGAVVISNPFSLVRNEWKSYELALADLPGFSSSLSVAELVISSSNPITLYLDNLYFYRQIWEPETAAPTPIHDPNTVISLFSDAYGDTAPVDTWLTSWSNAQWEEIQLDSNNSAVMKYTNFAFAGIQAPPIDVSNMTGLHMDVWSPDIGAVFKVKLVDFGVNGVFQDTTTPTSNDDSEFEIAVDTIRGEWMTLDLPLTLFPGLTSRQQLTQIILSGQHVEQFTLFLDNVYFYEDEPKPTEAAPEPTHSASNVVSLFSDAYSSSVMVDTWKANWSGSTVVLDEEFQVVPGDYVKKYTSLTWTGVETMTQPVNATSLNRLHFDLWTGGCRVFRIKLTDLGLNGVFDGYNVTGSDDSEHEMVFDLLTNEEWMSIDLPLSDFTNLLSPMAHLAQFIFSADWMCTAYLDNLYLYDATQPSVAAPLPTSLDDDHVLSLFSSTTQYPYIVTVDSWAAPDSSSAVLESVIINSGSTVLKYVDLGSATIEVMINATEISSFHASIWTNDCTSFRITLLAVYFSSSWAGGVLVTTSDSERVATFDLSTSLQDWNSLDINLPSSSFASTANAVQIVIDNGGGDGICTAFVDNVYFYKKDSQQRLRDRTLLQQTVHQPSNERYSQSAAAQHSTRSLRGGGSTPSM